MGGKKKAGGGKKKKAGDDDEINQDQLYEVLKAKVDSLKSRIFLEQERRDNAMALTEEIREKEQGLDTKMDEHHENTRDQVKAMTKIYKNMEDGKNTEIDKCSQEVSDQEAEKRKLQQEIAKLQKEKEDKVAEKQEQIGNLRDRINVISSNFAELLKSTLIKMQERIDDANQTYEGDQPQMMGGLGSDAA